MMQLSLQVEADRWRSSGDGDKVMVANADLKTPAVAKDERRQISTDTNWGGKVAGSAAVSVFYWEAAMLWQISSTAKSPV